MAKILVEVDEHTPDVVVPEDGVDFETAASLEPAFQRLANRSLYAHTRLTGTRTSTKANTTAGAQAASRVDAIGQSATSKYWLIEDASVDGTASRARLYRDASRSGLLVETYNARWDPTAGGWVRDSGAETSMKREFGSALVSGPQSRAMVLFFAGLVTTSGGWTDAEWNHFHFLGYDHLHEATFLALTGKAAPGNAPGPNTLYSNSFAKAWGSITAASGVFIQNDSMNIDFGGITLNGSFSVYMPFQTPMADGNYVVCPVPNVSGGGWPRIVSKTSTEFEIGYDDGSGTLINLTSNTRTFDFVVVGNQ